MTKSIAARGRLAALSLAALLAVVLAVAGCGSSGSSSSSAGTTASSTNVAKTVSNDELAGVTLKVGAFSPVNEAIFKAAGQDKNLPYKIEWVVNPAFGEGAPAFTAMKAGAIDVFENGDLPMIAGIAANADFKLIANSIGKDEALLQLVVPDGSSIHDAQDLEGKTVVTQQLSGAEYLVNRYLEEHNVPRSSVKFSFVEPTAALPAFQSGDVDAWSSYVPYTTQVLAAKQARLLVDGNGDGKGRLYSGLGFIAASEGALADPAKVAALEDFVHRMYEVNAWTEANLKQATAVYAKAFKLPASLAALFAEGSVKTYRQIDASSIAELQKVADTAKSYEMIPSSVEVEPYFDTTFNAAVEGGS